MIFPLLGTYRHDHHGVAEQPGQLAIAWYRDNSGERVHDVATREPNAWGRHDMLGNVWEWCWDLFAPEVYGPVPGIPRPRVV